MHRVDRLYQLLTEQLQPTYLEIRDNSEKHRGHAGAQNGGGHYALTISAPCLEGHSRIDAHKIIYRALGTCMEHDIHALEIAIIGQAENILHAQ